MNGGGETGDVSLSVQVPFNLSGATSGTSGSTTGIVSGSNTGNGYGVKGYSLSNHGVYGYSSTASAILGYSNNDAGVTGLNGSTGNEGRLGTANSGVYAKGITSDSVGIKGEHSPTGNNGSLGSSISGVYGYAKGTGSGVYGTNENGNYGYVGGAMYSLYASASSTDYWAGFFLGKTTVTGGQFEVKNSSGENWLLCLRGANQNSGISWQETEGNGNPETQWIFPYFRGWQSDNLIIRDEAAKRDVMIFQATTGKVGIGTVPETIFHVSSGTSGDTILLLEADTDNNNENDQPAIELRQDGGAVTAFIGFGDGGNELKVKSTDTIQFYTGSPGEQQLATSIDPDGNLHVSGNVQIDGTLTVTHHSFVSIPPAAFIPLSDGFYNGVQYSPERIALMPNSIGGINIPSYLYAPVNLPHGAEIVKITCWWEDNVSHVDTDHDPILELYRCSLNSGVKDGMAFLRSHWNDSDRHLQYAPDQSSDYASDSIEYNVIDNYQYEYTLFLYLPKADDDNNFCALGGVRIEYKYNP